MQALFEYNQQADAQFKETFNNLGDENIEKVRCGDEKGITVWSQHRALERLFKQIAAHTHTQGQMWVHSACGTCTKETLKMLEKSLLF